MAAADQSGDPEKTVSHQTPQAHVPTNSPVSSPTLRCRRRSWLRAPYPVCPTDNQILTPRRAPGHASRIAPLPPATLLLVPCWRVRVSITETSDWASGIAPVEIPLRRQTCRMFHCRGYLAIVPGCPETLATCPLATVLGKMLVSGALSLWPKERPLQLRRSSGSQGVPARSLDIGHDSHR